MIETVNLSAELHTIEISYIHICNMRTSHTSNLIWRLSDWANSWRLPAVERSAFGRGYVCLSLCKTALRFFFTLFVVAVKDQSSDVRWQPNSPPHIHLQWNDRLPISLSPVLGPGPWHLLDEHSLVLSLSANVWVYWCAVTGPGWSYPTRIRASCCASSVSVCALIATNRQ